MLDGTCHCGAIRLTLRSAHPPGELPVRICGCGFCRRHRPRYTADPSGQVAIHADPAALVRYRFGLELADFLLCGRCGVFVAAYQPGDPALAVINLEILDRAVELTAAPTRFTAYDDEDVATRIARRARTWTPATLELIER